MSEAIDLTLILEDEELLFTTDAEGDDRTWWNIREMDPDAFAALCIAVRRAANEREKTQGYKVKLEEP